MTTFLVIAHADRARVRPGGGPTVDGRVPFAVSAESEDEIRAELARDPRHESHLELVSIEPWTIRLRSPLLGDRV